MEIEEKNKLAVEKFANLLSEEISSQDLADCIDDAIFDLVQFKVEDQTNKTAPTFNGIYYLKLLRDVCTGKYTNI